MRTKLSGRKQVFKTGLAMVIVGAALGVTGFATSTAVADVNDHQVVVCHQEGNGGYSTPNPVKSQLLSTTNGHGLHAGDIIPPFAAGSKGNNTWNAFAGLNWDSAGRALYDTCAPCDTGTHDEFGDCTVLPAPSSCEVGQTGVYPDCVTPPAGSCEVGQTGTFPECVTLTSSLVIENVDPVVIPTTTTTAKAPVEVQGVQIYAAPAAPAASAAATLTAAATVSAAQLPRTGTDALPLAQVGFGMVLLGAGALLFGREQTIPV